MSKYKVYDGANIAEPFETDDFEVAKEIARTRRDGFVAYYSEGFGLFINYDPRQDAYSCINEDGEREPI